MNFSIIVFVVFACYTQYVYSLNAKVDSMKGFKAITNPDIYDKDMRPKLGEGNPVQVNITMFVIDYTFDPIKREMNANMYFRQKWNDPRLVSQAITADIVGGESLANRVWTPDTFFANSMAVNVMKYPSRNSFLMVNTKGDVYYSERLQIQFRCGAKVSTKNDECNLELESYGFSMVDIQYNWGNSRNNKSIGFSADSAHRNQYKLTQILSKYDSVTLTTGSYSRLLANFKLECKDCVDDSVDTHNVISTAI